MGQKHAPAVRDEFFECALLVTDPCPISAFKLAQRLQRSSTTLRPRLADTCRVRSDNQSYASGEPAFEIFGERLKLRH